MIQIVLVFMIGLRVIDQTNLPHIEENVTLKNSEDCVVAIKDMIIIGAGVIGCVGAFGVYLAVKETKEINEEYRFQRKNITDW